MNANRDQALYHLKCLVADGGNGDDAFALAMHLVNDLHEAGVHLYFTPSKRSKDVEFVQKYSGPERARPEKWVHVHLHPVTEQEIESVKRVEAQLHEFGIYFDTGGMVGLNGQRDWEFDWSFHLTSSK